MVHGYAANKSYLSSLMSKQLLERQAELTANDVTTDLLQDGRKVSCDMGDWEHATDGTQHSWISMQRTTHASNSCIVMKYNVKLLLPASETHRRVELCMQRRALNN
jgi:hypothetical protein